MVDAKLIQRKITFLAQLKKELIRYGVKSLSELSKNHQMEKAVEKTLQEMVEICLDIGKHIIADEGFRLPEDSKDIFSILNQEGILSNELIPIMINMAGFRNIVVHLYEKIDLEIVYGIYKKHLGDFDRFIEEIKSYIKGK